MSTVLKEKRNSWFARAVIAVIALAFIVGLGYTGGVPWGGISAGVAVTVNGESVPVSYYEHIRRQVRARRTEDLDRVPVALQDAIDRDALSAIIDRAALAQKARSLGVRVSDGAVAEAIKSITVFHSDGEFAGPEYYRAVVTRGMGLTVKIFEDSVRDDEAIAKLRDFSEVSSAVSEREFANLFAVTGEKLTLQIASFEDLEDAEKALAELAAVAENSPETSGRLKEVAEKFGGKISETEPFTRFEIPDYLRSAAAEIFALSPSNPFVRRVFLSDDAHRLAVFSQKIPADSETVNKKIEIAMRGAEREKIRVFNNWVERLRSSAEIETNSDIFR